MGYFFSLSKSATAAALGVSELALLAFGVVLVVGLIGEIKSKRKIFEWLVILGVAGELFADGGVFLFSNQLQTISDLELEQERASRLKLQTALTPFSMRESTERKIAAGLRLIAKPGINVTVEFTNGNAGQLAIGIHNALALAGFNPGLRITHKALYAVGISSSEHDWPYAREIKEVFARYIPITWSGEWLPPGSPITISVGESPLGPLP